MTVPSSDVRCRSHSQTLTRTHPGTRAQQQACRRKLARNTRAAVLLLALLVSAALLPAADASWLSEKFKKAKKTTQHNINQAKKTTQHNIDQAKKTVQNNINKAKKTLEHNLRQLGKAGKQFEKDFNANLKRLEGDLAKNAKKLRKWQPGKALQKAGKEVVASAQRIAKEGAQMKLDALKKVVINAVPALKGAQLAALAAGIAKAAKHVQALVRRVGELVSALRNKKGKELLNFVAGPAEAAINLLRSISAELKHATQPFIKGFLAELAAVSGFVTKVRDTGVEAVDAVRKGLEQVRAVVKRAEDAAKKVAKAANKAKGAAKSEVDKLRAAADPQAIVAQVKGRIKKALVDPLEQGLRKMVDDFIKGLLVNAAV